MFHENLIQIYVFCLLGEVLYKLTGTILLFVLFKSSMFMLTSFFNLLDLSSIERYIKMSHFD